MSGKGGGSHNNGGGKALSATIPASSRKMVQSLKEIVSNFPDHEIYATLKDCNMDPNEAVSRLLSQGSFLSLSISAFFVSRFLIFLSLGAKRANTFVQCFEVIALLARALRENEKQQNELIHVLEMLSDTRAIFLILGLLIV